MQLFASAKVKDIQYCKLGGSKSLKVSVPPWQLNLHTKRGWEENWDVGSRIGTEYINSCVDIYSGLLGFCESASMCKWAVKSLKLAFCDIFLEKNCTSGRKRVREFLIFIPLPSANIYFY